MSNQTFSIWDGSVASSFGGGTGTETNPYRINSAAQLAYLAEVFNDPDVKNNTYYGKYYKLTSNIDLDKREWEGLSGIVINCLILIVLISRSTLMEAIISFAAFILTDPRKTSRHYLALFLKYLHSRILQLKMRTYQEITVLPV